MPQKKNIILGIVSSLISIILLINISISQAQESKKNKNDILVEINILDKVSSKNTILKLNLGEEKNFKIY